MDANYWYTDSPSHIPYHGRYCCLQFRMVHHAWTRTNNFHTFVKCADKVCKLVIDEGCSMNAVSKSGVARMRLEPKPHPQPYELSWVDDTIIQVSERCLVPIQMGGYSDCIWCDVLPENIAHVLLGRPWIEEVDATYNSEENTHMFKCGAKFIRLKPAMPIKKVSSIHEHIDISTQEELVTPPPSSDCVPSATVPVSITIHPPSKDLNTNLNVLQIMVSPHGVSQHTYVSLKSRFLPIARWIDDEDSCHLDFENLAHNVPCYLVGVEIFSVEENDGELVFTRCGIG